MASDVDRLLADLIGSDDEEDASLSGTAGGQAPNSADAVWLSPPPSASAAGRVATPPDVGRGVGSTSGLAPQADGMASGLAEMGASVLPGSAACEGLLTAGFGSGSTSDGPSPLGARGGRDNDATGGATAAPDAEAGSHRGATSALDTVGRARAAPAPPPAPAPAPAAPPAQPFLTPTAPPAQPAPTPAPAPAAAAPVAPPPSPSEGDAPSTMQVARELEARLRAQSSDDGTPADDLPEDQASRDGLLLSSLDGTLDGCDAAWGVDGWTDERGSTVGCQGAARSFLLPGLETLFRGTQPRGPPCCVAKYLSFVAVGTSGGAVFVLVPAPQGKPPRLVELGNGACEPRGGVSSLAMGQCGGQLLLLAGHASGELRVWELRSAGGGGGGGGGGSSDWHLARALAGLHASAVTSCAVLGALPNAPAWALSGDAYGRVVAHNLSRHLSLTSQALTSFARSLTGSANVPSHVLDLRVPAAGDARARGTEAPVHSIEPLPAQRRGDGDGALRDVYAAHPQRGHFALIVLGRVATVIQLAPQDGRASAVHVFLPPGGGGGPHSREPEPAYAAWTLTRAGDDGEPLGLGATARVAVAWGRTLAVYEAGLVAAGDGAGLVPPAGVRGPQPAGARPPAPRYIGGVLLRGPACGLAYMARGPLVAASCPSETATAVTVLRGDSFLSAPHSPRPDDPALDLGIDRLSVRDWAVSADPHLSGTLPAAFHGALAGGGDQLLLLGAQGVRVVHLVAWQQRLAALQASGRGAAALLASCRLLGARHAGLEDPGGEVAWPADAIEHGAGAGAELKRRAGELLVSLLDAKLAGAVAGADGGGSGSPAAGPSPPSPPPHPHPHHAREPTVNDLADASITACLLLRSPALLSSDVFHRFCNAGARDAFLARLVPHALAGRTPSPGPEIVQALVSWCAARGRPGTVERCVLRFDLASLDLNQLIPLCVRHGLHFALADIFARALRDWQTPAQLLLVAASAAAEPEEERGEAPGTGSVGGRSRPAAARHPPLLPKAPEDSRVLVGTLLRLLEANLLGKAYPPGSGRRDAADLASARAQATSFLLHADALGTWETWRQWTRVARVPWPKALPRSVHDPHAALRFLLAQDATSTLGVLREALAGWDALERDLAELVPGLARQLRVVGVPEGRTVAQAFADALVDLVELDEGPGDLGGGPGRGVGSGSDEPAGGRPSPEAQEAALDFLATLVASGRIAATPPVTLRLLQRLATSGGGSEGQAVEVATLGGELGDAMRSDAVAAMEARGWHCAAARLLHRSGRREEALASLARASSQPVAACQYAREVLQEGGLEPAARTRFLSAVVAATPDLVDLDARAVAKLFLAAAPESQGAVVRALGRRPRAQHAYLRALLELRRTLRAAADNGATAGPAPLSPRSMGADGEDGAAAAAAAAAREVEAAGLLDVPDVADLTVRLMCEYDPGAALPFLRSNRAYRLEGALLAAREAGRRDAVAFLLERRGDVQEALTMYTIDCERANSRLGEALEAEAADGEGDPASALAVAHDAMLAARDMCARFSRDNAPAPGSPETAASRAQLDACRRLWLQLLRCYTVALWATRQPGGGRRARATRELRRSLAGLMEEVMEEAASYVPVSDLAAGVLGQGGADSLGLLRGPLLSMLRASEGELALLRSADRASGWDGAEILTRCYRACTAPVRLGLASNDGKAEGESRGVLQGPKRWAAVNAASQAEGPARVAEMLRTGAAAIGNEMLARVQASRVGGDGRDPPSPSRRSARAN